MSGTESQKPSADFLMGILFTRADGHDAKFIETDKQIGLLRNDMASLNANVTTSIAKVVEQVDTMLKAQTDELKPLITEKVVRDANALAAKNRQEGVVVFWQKVGGIIAVLVFLLGVVTFAFNEKDKVFITEHTTISSPEDRTP